MATERNRLYRLLQVGNRWLSEHSAGWDESCYRDLLARHGATAGSGFSASSMNLTQLEQAVREMKALGFTPKRSTKSRAKDWRAPRIAKLNALWCAMADSGVIEHRSETAMERWCERQVPGLTKLAWATSAQLNKAVEMMKSMAARQGVDVE